VSLVQCTNISEAGDLPDLIVLKAAMVADLASDLNWHNRKRSVASVVD
jgi:hypothetical protein